MVTRCVRREQRVDLQSLCLRDQRSDITPAPIPTARARLETEPAVCTIAVGDARISAKRHSDGDPSPVFLNGLDARDAIIHMALPNVGVPIK